MAISIRNYQQFNQSELVHGIVLRNVIYRYDDRLEESAEKEFGDALLEALSGASADMIMGMIVTRLVEDIEVTRQGIPEFSSLDVIEPVLDVLQRVDNPNLSYAELGFYLDGEAKTASANQKFGENHFKLAQQLSLASTDSGRKFVTAIGKSFHRAGNRALRAKLILTMPFMQMMLLRGEASPVQLIAVLREYLSETTVRRRRSSIETLAKEVKWLGEQGERSIIGRLGNVDWESLR